MEIPDLANIQVNQNDPDVQGAAGPPVQEAAAPIPFHQLEETFIAMMNQLTIFAQQNVALIQQNASFMQQMAQSAQAQQVGPVYKKKVRAQESQG